ncbi:hypothetical protein BJ742DRAFT_803620 [Cladochytrium replicatum]|nr:hypothetical protein BJ742DRAFT_803620 [Cladochytrium replicatum]
MFGSPTMTPELLFIVAQFLSGTGCQRAYGTLVEEIEQKQRERTEGPSSATNDPSRFLLPYRVDWKGNFWPLNFEEVSRRYTHVRAAHLSSLIDGSAKAGGNNMRFPFEGRSLGSDVYSRGVDRLIGLERGLPKARKQPRMVSYLSHAQRLVTVKGHTNAIYCLLFDRLGRRFFTGGDDNIVRVWDAHTGWLVHTLRGHRSILPSQEAPVILDITINDANTMVATASSDRTVAVWKHGTFELLGILEVGKDISTICFSPTASDEIACMLVTCFDGHCRVFRWNGTFFDQKPFQIRCSRLVRDRVWCAGFNPTGTRFATGGDDGYVYLYCYLPSSFGGLRQSELASTDLHLVEQEDGVSHPVPKLLATLEGHKDRIKDVSFSHRGDRILTGSKDGTARIWSFDGTLKKWTSICLSTNRTPNSKAESSQQNHPSNQENPFIVTTEGPQPPPVELVPSSAVSISNLPLLTDSTIDASIDTTTNPPAVTGLGLIPALGQPEPGVDATSAGFEVTTVTWSEDDRYILTAFSDFSIHLWDSTTGELCHVFIGHERDVYTIECNPQDTNTFLSAGYDGRIILWDVERRVEVKRFTHNCSILCARFSPDGKMIVASDDVGMVHLYGLPAFAESYNRTPLDQFFPVDWNRIVVDANNELMDEVLQLPPYSVDPGLVVDVYQTPYTMYEEIRPKLLRSIPEEDELCKRVREEKLYLLNEEGKSFRREQFVQTPLPNENKKPVKYQRRRRAVESDHEMEIENATTLSVPEYSSGDEYVTDGNDEKQPESESESEGVQSETPSENQRVSLREFVVDDDQGDPSSARRSKHRTRRNKRNLKGKSPSRPRKKRKIKLSDDDDDIEGDIDAEGETDDEMEAIVPSPISGTYSPEPSSVDLEENNVSVSSKPQNGVKHRSRKRRVGAGRQNYVVEEDFPNLSAEEDEPKPQPFPRPPVSLAVRRFSPWLIRTVPVVAPYLPQIHDVVVYVKAGHESLHLASTMPGNPAEKLRGHLDAVIGGIPEVAYGVVVGIEYLSTPATACKLSVQFTPVEASGDSICPDRDEIFQNALDLYNYPTDDSPDGYSKPAELCIWELEFDEYIILYENYRGSLEQDFKLGDGVQVSYVDEDCNAVILEIEASQSPWKTFQVGDWVEEADSAADKFSSWDLFRSEEDRSFRMGGALDDDDGGIISEMINAVLAEEYMSLFADAVDTEIYVDYSYVIICPVWLNLILERLEHRFYRRVESVLWDIALCRKNAMIYNDETSAIYNAAKDTLSKLHNSIAQRFGIIDSFLVDPPPLINIAIASSSNKGKQERSKTSRKGKGRSAKRSSSTAALHPVSSRRSSNRKRPKDDEDDYTDDGEKEEEESSESNNYDEELIGASSSRTRGGNTRKKRRVENSRLRRRRGESTD